MPCAHRSGRVVPAIPQGRSVSLRLIASTLILVSIAAPLSGQEATVVTPVTVGSPLTVAGVTRAAAMVDSVFLDRQRTTGLVDVGDFTAYLLARLGVPPLPDTLGFRVTADTARIRIRGRLKDFTPEARAELGPLFAFLDSTSTVLAELSMPERANGVMRFRLERLLVREIPVPEFLFLPALAEYARRYPVLTTGGREFLVAMPPGATAMLRTDSLELKLPGKKPATSGNR